MKIRTLLLSWIVAVAGAALAGVPQPAVVFYGQAVDAYGWPYRADADVILRVGTNDVARHSIAGSLAPGVNFALHVPIDDGRDGKPYVQYAATTGAVVSIAVVDGAGERFIMENASLPPVPAAGSIVRVNVTAGTDADADGIPDEWEWELIRWANDPAFASLADVRPGDDFDGDGISNLDEYRAGTFAFLHYDSFSAEAFHKAPNGRLGIDFLTVPGKVYRIQCAPLGLVDGAWAWAGCEFSATSTGALQTGPVEGTGQWQSFYVSPPESNVVWRLTVE
jgi:hypothetical protein